MRFYEAVVDLSLYAASKADPQELALHFYKTGEPAGDVQGHEAFVARFVCLFVCLFVYLFVCLFVYLFVSLLGNRSLCNAVTSMPLFVCLFVYFVLPIRALLHKL